MIYVIYPLLIFALFYKSRLSKMMEFNEEAFSLKQMKAIQGFTALCIMFHHIGQKTCASWLDKRYYVAGLEIFVPVGYWLVAVFLFCTGYGLYKSYKTKAGYLSRAFIVKRILPIVFTAYLVNFIFLAARIFLIKEEMDTAQFLFYFTGLQMTNPNGWYVVVMPFFYLFFFLTYRFIKNDRHSFLALVLIVAAYQILGTQLDHHDWWLGGEWWYNSIHMLPVGIFFAAHEEGIKEHLKKHYVIYLIAAMIGLALFSILSAFGRDAGLYYGDYWQDPLRAWKRRLCLLFEMANSFAFVFLLVMLSLKIRFGNRFLWFMGSMTLEFYMIHGLFVELFCYAFDAEFKPLYYIRNNFYFTVVVFVLALPSAFLLSRLRMLIFNGKTGRKNEQG